jgi:hypothetical protein
VFEASAVIAGFDDVAMMRQAVEQGRRHLRVGEHGRPFGEGEVGRDDDRGAFVQATDQVEQQLAAGLGERQIAEFVEHQQVDAHQAVGDAAASALLGLGFEFVDEIDDVEEPGFPARPDDAADDADGDVALAGASRDSVTMPGVRRLR